MEASGNRNSAERKPKQNQISTERIRRLFKKTKETEGRQTKNEIPEDIDDYTFDENSHLDPFTRKLINTKIVLTSNDNIDKSVISRKRTSSLKRSNSLTERPRSRRRSRSFQMQYSWESTPSFHHAAKPDTSESQTPDNVIVGISETGGWELQAGDVLDLFECLFDMEKG